MAPNGTRRIFFLLIQTLPTFWAERIYHRCRNWDIDVIVSVLHAHAEHTFLLISQGRPKAQARPKARFWKSGDLEIQKFGIQQIKKIKSLKIQIRSAQNVGKVWISRKKILPALFGAILGHFFHGPKKIKKDCKILPIFPVWGPCCYPPGVGE